MKLDLNFLPKDLERIIKVLENYRDEVIDKSKAIDKLQDMKITDEEVMWFVERVEMMDDEDMQDFIYNEIEEYYLEFEIEYGNCNEQFECGRDLYDAAFN